MRPTAVKLIAVGLLSAVLLTGFCLAQAPTEAQREERRKIAEEIRIRNAREREEIQKGFAPPNRAPQPQPASFSNAQICKATVASLMKQPPTIIGTAEQDGVVLLSYRRPSDGSQWNYRCRISGETVVWASNPGRWRDGPRDEKVTYRLKGATDITIRQQFSDGSSSDDTFARSSL